MPHLRRPDEGTPERLPRRASALPAVRQVREMTRRYIHKVGVLMALLLAALLTFTDDVVGGEGGDW